MEKFKGEGTQCQTVNSQGQCLMKAVENSNHCECHGGNKAQEAYNKRSLNMYRLAKYQDRVNDFSGHNDVKSLQQEIGILRMMLEEKWNTVSRSPMDFQLAYGPLSDLIMKIERLVASCHKIDNQMGNLLDRQRVQIFASTLLQVVDTKIKETTLPDAEQGALLASIGAAFLEKMNGLS